MRGPSTPIRRALAGALVLAVAAAAACSDSSGSDGASAPDSSTTTSSPSTSATASTTTTTIGLPERAPRAAEDAAGLAAQIEGAERAVRDRDTPPGVLAEQAVVQQVAYRALGNRPELDDAVLERLPHDLRRDARRHIAARRSFRKLVPKLMDTLPAWRIVEPEPAADLQRFYKEASAEFGIGWEYLAAINLVETGMGRIRGTSTAGAQGPMQFLPATWDAFGGGGDINDPRDAIFGAARYLAHNNGANDIANALWNYNHSDHYVEGVSSYAAIIRDDPATYLGFHAWGVFYRSTVGDVWLPVGYEQTERIDATQYLATHPQ